MHHSSLEEVFSTYQFFPDDTYEKVIQYAPLVRAMEVAKQLCHSLGARIGTTKRVIITDGGDCTVFEWTHDRGIIWPADINMLGQWKPEKLNLSSMPHLPQERLEILRELNVQKAVDYFHRTQGVKLPPEGVEIGLHRSRYHCTQLSDDERLASLRWLRAKGHTDMCGMPLPKDDILPSM